MKRRESSTTAGALLCALIIGHYAAPSQALINLEWRPVSQTTQVDDLVEIGLYAVSDDPEIDQYILAMDVILNWDPAFLELVGNVDNGPYSWLSSGFPVGDVDGLNDTFADGDALYTALGQLGAGAWATPEGLLVTTVQFTALAETPSTSLIIAEDAGSYTHTAIWGGPGLDVTGTLGSAQIEIVCQVCPGDLDGDDDIDLSDLAELLSHYGTTSGAAPSDGDMDCDGDIDLSDLAALLAVYGTTCE